MAKDTALIEDVFVVSTGSEGNVKSLRIYFDDGTRHSMRFLVGTTGREDVARLLRTMINEILE